MTTALVSNSGFYDFGDILSYKSNRNALLSQPHFGLSESKKLPARRVSSMTVSSMSTPSNNNTTTSPQKIVSMHQKLSSSSVLQPSSGHHNNNNCPQSPLLSPSNIIMPPQQVLREHRKLDRSMSEPVHQQQPSGILACRSNSSVVGSTMSAAAAAAQAAAQAAQNASGQQANSSRYKTELCRPFEENGTCKYGDKCQFAHGYHELRTLARHPKYKTELCRTFHTTGFCPYGPRCHFIHNSEETKKGLLMSGSSNGGLAIRSNSIGGDVGNRKGVVELSSRQHSRPKALSIGSFSLGSAGDLSPPSSLSASPTSLNGFFTEDPFFASPGGSHFQNQHQNHQNQPPSTPNTAFSFSQDFANALVNPKPSSMGVAFFGGSQPATSNVYVGSPQSASSDFLADTVNRDPLFKFPEAPPSPVDSLSSELETVSLRGNSPDPSHLQQSPASPSGDALLGSPRLPIFSRLSNVSDSD